jgi:hypothetical protein
VKPTVAFVVLFLVLASPSLASTTWYVDGVHGNGTNNCLSPTTACASISRAISLATSGDTVKVAPALYIENLTIPISLQIIGANPKNTGILPAMHGPSVITIPNETAHVAISGLTIAGGRSNADGGGISNYGQLVINDCIIGNNKADFFGGAISTHGSFDGAKASLSINKTTIFYNSAPEGGGIQCSPPSQGLRISNSLIFYNVAKNGNGGGILGASGYGSCGLDIVNTTITENAAGQGGGIFGGGWISNSTIAANSATQGARAGIYGGFGIQNSILSSNYGINNSTENCGGSSESFGYNISSDASCPFTAGTGDLVNTDPLLGPLQNNGGSTWTMALLPGSPAIDSGNPSGCTDFPDSNLAHGNILHIDQRGDHRPGDPKLTTGCDRGAYELQFPK